MNNPTKYLAFALALCSMTLVACGGGGGGDDSVGSSGLPVPDPLVVQPLSTAPPAALVPAVSFAAADLQVYEGKWKQACDNNHKQLTTTLVFEASRVFTATPRKEYFENADCTGAVIAVGTYDTFREKVVVAVDSQVASVNLGSGLESESRTVNPAESTISTTSYLLFNESGSAVTIDNSVPSIPVTYINYPDGTKEVYLPEPSFAGGITSGALLIEGSEFLTLNIVSAVPPAYIVNQRFQR